jgi:hypothetical protein
MTPCSPAGSPSVFRQACVVDPKSATVVPAEMVFLTQNQAAGAGSSKPAVWDL